MNNVKTSSAQLSLDELEAQLTELTGHLNAANYRYLMLIAEFDRREGWGDGVTQSCAHWLSWKCGLDRGAAREKVRVARALKGLPLISASMSRGEVSYSKVRALTRVATPETEDDLLNIALHGTAHHVETLVRHYRRALSVTELTREAQQFANRGVSYFYDDDGSLVLNGRLTAEAGAAVVRALEVALENSWCPRRSSAAHVSAETSGASTDCLDPESIDPVDPHVHAISHRRADALALVAETFLKHGLQAMSGGERQQIVIHVDAETLAQGKAGRCEVEDGTAIALETARRVACDASVVKIIEGEDGEPLNVGRKTRTIPPAIRRALRSRDTGCCRFPGCDNTRFLDGHHIRHWADGGETKLSNLVLLCRFHHRSLHEGRFHIDVLDDGALRFTGPKHKYLRAVTPVTGSLHSMVCQHKERGIDINEKTGATRWLGECMDYGMAIDGLLAAQRKGRRVSAETSVTASPLVCTAKAKRRRRSRCAHPSRCADG